MTSNVDGSERGMTHGKSKPHLTCGLTCEISSFLVLGRTVACEIEAEASLFGFAIILMGMVWKKYFIKNIFIWNWFNIYVYLVNTVVEIEVE